MSRLIDKDKLLENYKKWIPQLSSKEDEGDRRGVETCIAVLEDTPTVDAVAVVRCRECKFWHESEGWCDEHSHFTDSEGAFCHPWESTEWRMFAANDFCSYGELKGGAD